MLACLQQAGRTAVLGHGQGARVARPGRGCQVGQERAPWITRGIAVGQLLQAGVGGAQQGLEVR
ncbi:hypothetical protein GCM10009642_17590 [Nocardiopsis metallicus]